MGVSVEDVMNSRACSPTAVGSSAPGSGRIGTLSSARAIGFTPSDTARAVPVAGLSQGQVKRALCQATRACSPTADRCHSVAGCAPAAAGRHPRKRRSSYGADQSALRRIARVVQNRVASQAAFGRGVTASLRWPCCRGSSVGTTLTPNKSFQPTSGSSLRSSPAAAELHR